MKVKTESLVNEDSVFTYFESFYATVTDCVKERVGT